MKTNLIKKINSRLCSNESFISIFHIATQQAPILVEAFSICYVLTTQRTTITIQFRAFNEYLTMLFETRTDYFFGILTLFSGLGYSTASPLWGRNRSFYSLSKERGFLICERRYFTKDLLQLLPLVHTLVKM